MSWRGLAAGALTLIIMQALTAQNGKNSGVARGGALLKWVATGIDKALNPKIAAVPIVKDAAAAAATSSAPTTGTTALPRNPAVGGNTVTV